MELKEAIMKKILRKLMNSSMWGGKHTEIKNLQKSLPAHVRGTKDYKNAVKELLKLNFLNVKPSTGEHHVSLNNQKQREIIEFLEE